MSFCNRLISMCLALGLGLGLASAGVPASAQDAPFRWVIVNNKVLDASELAFIDRLNCGEAVADGVYWLNMTNGTWGVVGQPGAALLPSCTQAATPQPEPAEAQAQAEAPAPSIDYQAEIRKLRAQRERSYYMTELTRMQNARFNR